MTDFAIYRVCVRETFQTIVHVEAVSQAAAKRSVLGRLRVEEPTPPEYDLDVVEAPRSIRCAAVAAWEEA